MQKETEDLKKKYGILNVEIPEISKRKESTEYLSYSPEEFKHPLNIKESSLIITQESQISPEYQGPNPDLPHIPNWIHETSDTETSSPQEPK